MSEFAAKFVSIIPTFKGGGRAIQQELDRSGDAAGKSAGKKAGGGFSAAFGSSLKGFVGFAAITAGASALVRGVSGATTAASDLNETINKGRTIFGDSFAEIDRWARGSAKALGLPRQAALDAASGFGDMFSQIGFSGAAATRMSKSVVQMSADLGSFNNLETADVADRMSAAFRGEYDSLQALIPNINAARVESVAMATTGKKNAAALTAQEKAAAVLAIVNKDGARAMGDFARTADGAANKQKILAARTADAKAKFGEALLPLRLFVIDGLMKVLDFAPRIGAALSGLGIGGFVRTIVLASKAMASAFSGEGVTSDGIVGFFERVGVAGRAFAGWVTGSLVPTLQRFAPTALAVFSQVYNIVASALALVQAVVARVVQFVTIIWAKWGQDITAFAAAAWSGIVTVIQAALALVQAIISTVLAIVRGDWSGAWEGIKQILASAWDLIKAIVSLALTVIRGAISGALGVIKSVWSAAWGAVKAKLSEVWDGIKSAVTQKVTEVASKVGEIRQRVLDKLSGFGALLRDKGRELIQGLINGITDKIAAIGDAMSRVAGKIKGFLPGSPVKEGPLVSWNNGGAGKRLGGLLAQGLDASRATVAAASSRMAAAVVSPNSPDARATAFAGSAYATAEDFRSAVRGLTLTVDRHVLATVTEQGAGALRR